MVPPPSFPQVSSDSLVVGQPDRTGNGLDGPEETAGGGSASDIGDVFTGGQLSIGTISGIVVACVAVVGGIGAAIWYLYRKRVLKKRNEVGAASAAAIAPNNMPGPPAPYNGKSEIDGVAVISGMASPSPISTKASPFYSGSTPSPAPPVPELHGMGHNNRSELSGARPMQELSGVRPMQELSGVRPVQELSGVRPVQELSGVRPVQELSGVRPTQEMPGQSVTPRPELHGGTAYGTAPPPPNWPELGAGPGGNVYPQELQGQPRAAQPGPSPLPQQQGPQAGAQGMSWQSGPVQGYQ